MTGLRDDSFTIAAPLAGWVVPLAAVPDPVFAERMLGDGIAIDPIGDTLFAPCDGEILTVNEARHALSLRCASGAELILHLGIDTVALQGEGIEAFVKPGDRVATGDPLLRFDLDLLVRRAPAVVTPIIVCDPQRFAVEVIAEGQVEPGEALLRVRPVGEISASRAASGPTQARQVQVALAHGIHARPAARLVAACRGLDVEATIFHDDKKASASSAIGLLGLGAGHGAILRIEARGADADAALDAITAILTHDLPEEEAPPAAVPAMTGPGLIGVPAAPGLAIGPAHWLHRQTIEIAEEGEGIEIERAKLDSALANVRDEMRTESAAPGPRGAVIGAQLALLDDPALAGAAHAELESGSSAAAAWRNATEAQSAILLASGDRRIAERAEDLRDIEGRLLAELLGQKASETQVPEGAIVLADELLPSQIVMLDPAKVAGIALIRGGPTSHAAILAAGMGLPMAVAFGPALSGIGEGSTVIIDADCGSVDPDPPAERLEEARARIERRVTAEAVAREAGDALCCTSDGTRIEVFANLGSLADAETAVAQGAEGCGLLRTEFLFLDRSTPPSEAEQLAQYQAIADALGDRPLIVRLLDVGGDKPAPYLDLAAEENPALGLRGIRVGLARADLLETQIRAILSVEPKGRCRIMAPMVASLAELEAVAAMIDRLGGGAEIGVMVETPAAAMTADLLSRRASFLSIGSNDLTQYALAMDRGNASVAAGVDGLHPAVLRLIARACDDARKQGTLVAICGGLAADPLAVPILIGLGVRELSVPPTRIAATKAVVGQQTLKACEALAAEALALDSAAAVRAFVAAFERNVP
ncbi:MAG: phosphoenolpyruvate--protein phosphotransferase [Pseudomonadota bacterium]|nr:phosphoenolpyruvate--protein phosphotransferase [Pseudomonadota bacterium]